jgi:hypothetical protein
MTIQFTSVWTLLSPVDDQFRSKNEAGSIPVEAIGFLNWPNPSSSTIALGSTQPLIDMSTKYLPGGKGRPVHKADNLTTICESIV